MIAPEERLCTGWTSFSLAASRNRLDVYPGLLLSRTACVRVAMDLRGITLPPCDQSVGFFVGTVYRDEPEHTG